MSVAYYIVLDDAEPGFETFVNGKAIAGAWEELEDLCQKNGLPTLESFLGQSLAYFEDMLDEDEEDDDDDEWPEDADESELWFEVESGLNLVNSLISAIQVNPKAISEPDEVLSDLAEYKEVLQQAQTIQAKWHLAIDI